MLSLPLVAPRDSHELWFGSSRPRYRGSINGTNSETPASRRHQLHSSAHNNGNLLANPQTSTRALFSSTTPSNSLAMLQLEERALRLRKENIASFGAAWIKPAGIPKTMQGMREEEAEREEGLAAAQQELNVAAMVAAAGGVGDGVTDMDAFGGGDTTLQQQQQDMLIAGGDGAGAVEEGDGIGPDELERDLDDDIPEAEDDGFGDSDDDEGLIEEGEEGYEDELMERNLDDDIPDGFPEDDDDDEDDDEDDYDDGDDELPSASEIMVRDLDDDIPEANDLEDEDMDEESEAEEWQHTDSELEDNDDSDLDRDDTNTHDPYAHFNSGGVDVVSTNTQTPATTDPARRRSRRSSTRQPPPPPSAGEVHRTRETAAQRRFLQRWSGIGGESDSDNDILASSMVVDDDEEDDDDLRASITNASYARNPSARIARMRQAQSRFGRFMRRGGPRDSLD